jgi:alkylhydroperoxidase/carboxymuconolactone decarboxylase family protein YurZ
MSCKLLQIESKPMSNEPTLAERLSDIRAKRGFLLPHHGLMAVTSPKLLGAYDAAYTAMALDDRILDHHDREFVWLAVLIATDEAAATHHIAKFLKAGGTQDEIAAVLSLTAVALGFKGFRFVERHWLPHLPDCDPTRVYLNAMAGVSGVVSARLRHLAAAAVHVCNAAWDALEIEIAACYLEGVAEADLAEAVSLAMFPGSIPHFVEAAGVWRDMILAGKVDASPAFREWANMSGQGGFDEASKTR